MTEPHNTEIHEHRREHSRPECDGCRLPQDRGTNQSLQERIMFQLPPTWTYWEGMPQQAQEDHPEPTNKLQEDRKKCLCHHPIPSQQTRWRRKDYPHTGTREGGFSVKRPASTSKLLTVSQAMMDNTFWDMKAEGWIIIYMDNIFILTKEL